MSKLKVGDKVRCVDADRVKAHLVVDKEYVVLELNPSRSCVRVNNDSSRVFDDGRFELVTEPKVNQWQVLLRGMTHSPDSNTIEFHTMPDGVVMWRIPEPVITDGEMRFQPSHERYDWDEGIYRTLKGKTKDGKPFGVWTVDFGGDT